MSTFREMLTNEAIKTHPNIKAMLPLFKSKGYKAKVQYGQLTISFEKGTSVEDATKEFMKIAPGKWEQDKNAKGANTVYLQGDLSVAIGEYGGKPFAQVNE